MDPQTEEAGNDQPDTDTSLQAAVWLAQDLDIAMPPIPAIYETRIEEVSVGRLFATDPALLDLDTPGSITAALEAGWPKAGLAFGYLPRGSGGRWFYTLTSEQMILHVSLRLQNGDDATARASAALLSQAHARLERFLSEPSNLSRAISPDPLPDDVARRIVTFSDADGLTLELHATWSPASGLQPADEREEIFGDAVPAEPVGHDRVIWG